MGLERTIHLNLSDHPSDHAPSRVGHSIGRWEGDMLIVDFSVVLSGYRSDFTNTLVVGKPPNPEQQRLSSEKLRDHMPQVLDRHLPVRGEFSGNVKRAVELTPDDLRAQRFGTRTRRGRSRSEESTR